MCHYTCSQYINTVDEHLKETLFASYSEQTGLTLFIQSINKLLEKTIAADKEKSVEKLDKYKSYVFWANICTYSEYITTGLKN